MKNKLFVFFLSMLIISCSDQKENESIVSKITGYYESENEKIEFIRSYFSEVEGGEILDFKLHSSKITVIKVFEKTEDYKEIVIEREDLSKFSSHFNDVGKMVQVINYLDHFNIKNVTYSKEEDRLSMYFSASFYCVYLIYESKASPEKHNYSADKKYWRCYINKNWYINKVSCDL